MKLKQGLIITFSLLILKGYSQNRDSTNYNYKAVYKHFYQNDSLDNDSKKEEFMVLNLNSKTSKFSSLGKHIKDSLFSYYKNKPRTDENFYEFRSKVPKMHHTYTIIQNLSNKEIKFLEKIGTDKFYYEENIDRNWNILTETKVILGYEAQKAKIKYGGRNYTAWFTEEIPIPSGPYKFGGLPGLIVQIEDDKNHYVFQLESFERLKNQTSNFLIIQDYLKVEKDKFIKLKRGYNSNPFAIMEQSGMSFSFEKGDKEKLMLQHKKKLQKFNNPIELQ